MRKKYISHINEYDKYPKTTIKKLTNWLQNLLEAIKNAIKNHSPLKQGLRQEEHKSDRLVGGIIKNHSPLKQGLRPCSVPDPEITSTIKNHSPLKQGLRLFSIVINKILHTN